ncbi:hypothetical protein VOLCADRAFT_108124 [Volvox carteri f. nagariensis]|uniref:Mitochondrial fission 1 protein n=1 Tax=Volvox carteri f. nagariensis TaxID=3068 RepID=D8UID6_VOLCA|nr:uncharacterized protein VOLCADRAFT_108124 [Volvox carteri f. nagariensis]EFJ40492.1 hypothetical protein VOLCADRAFT_108124 [Volvox carteri f. nagariensis]|eukprot:XP_002958416.1 hypothetical protein VOLCADRAFT_108124 [Volvox carteri f. nagariensis]
MGQEHLPSVDLDFVKHAEDEYHSIYQTGTSDEVDGARFRLVWALVHSTNRSHQSRGLELCRAKLREQAKDKEFRYFAAVASYNLGQYIEARRELSSLLQEHPGFRQAEFLRGLVEDAIVREGLLGLKLKLCWGRRPGDTAPLPLHVISYLDFTRVLRQPPITSNLEFEPDQWGDSVQELLPGDLVRPLGGGGQWPPVASCNSERISC